MLELLIDIITGLAVGGGAIIILALIGTALLGRAKRGSKPRDTTEQARQRERAKRDIEARHPHPGRKNGQREFRQRWEG